MKMLKILLILLVPALGFVGCQKSNIKPGCDKTNTESTSTNSRLNNTTTQENINDNNAPVSTDIIGSGDDDRDGGDKKSKKTRM